MRIRPALGLFRSAKTENHNHSAATPVQTTRGFSNLSAIIFNSHHQPQSQFAIEHRERIKRLEEELTRVRSELNDALNSGKSAEYRAEKMAELFPKVRKLEETVSKLSAVNLKNFELLDQFTNEEPVKATRLKT